ncbi:hypothetical protein [Psychroserpens mesophilus]|jgi:hypothetical protein|uniref:hypothetical protein n=1 Tax=Psychroserpens mesophilus TaxID=325473 RepID=UPI003D6559C2
MGKDRNRVKFYSKSDMASGHQLKEAEKVLNAYKEGSNYSINDFIEFYEINVYFENDLFLLSWSANEKENYTLKALILLEATKQFWINSIENKNILSLFEEVDYGFYDSFWAITNKLNVYKKIDKQVFEEITKSNRFSIRPLLKQQKIVNFFSQKVRNFLINNTISAEILLSYYEEAKEREKEILYFPNSLNDLDKENLIIAYINYPEANINYIKLIENSKTVKLSNKTKLLAKKKAKQLNDEAFKNSNVLSQGVGVSISKDQKEPSNIFFDKDNRRLIYTYSEDYLNTTKSFIGIYKNFNHLFNFINFQGCIDLVYKESEVDTFEKILMRSKNEYHISFSFHRQSLTSHLQIISYAKYLESHNIYIEDSLNYVVNEYLNQIFPVNGLRIKFPTKETSYEEKIRSLAPELEFLIKQYQSYVENNSIDFELLEFSSEPLYYSKLKSKIEQKYVYGKGDDFLRLKYDFFSDQSSLFYTEKFKSKHKNLYELLTKENVLYSDFKGYQTPEIDYLISKKMLSVNSDGYVKIYNKNLVHIISVLHYQGVLNYWYYPENIRSEVLLMKANNLIVFDNSLFTEEERRYFNYYLNKKEFTNGLDLRNKYLHGSNSKSVDEHERDYYILLKLLILAIHKINEDLKLENTANHI